MPSIFAPTFALMTLCLMLSGCGKPQNSTVDTQSDLWAQREAFYADPNNAKQADEPAEKQPAAAKK